MAKYPNPLTGELHELYIKNPQPGIYAGVPHSQYLAIEALSRSALAKFRDAPEYFLFETEDKDDASDALKFGTLYHAYIFEQDRFFDTFVEGPMYKRSKADKEKWAELEEEYGIDYVYRPQDLEKVKRMYEALQRYPKAHGILKNDNPKELTIVFEHADSGFMCKIKVDILIPQPGWVLDLKTTRSALPHRFRFSARDYAYDLQSGFYVMGCQMTKGLEHVERFAVVAQEKEEPFMVRSFDMGEYVHDGIVESNRLLMELRDWHEKSKPIPDGMIQLEKYSLS